jgi:hypothetical protein
MSESRSFTATVPRRKDVRWASFQFEVREGDSWTPVQAGLVNLAPRQSSLNVSARIPDGARSWRVTWVAEGGSAIGLESTDPKPL